MNLNIKAFFGLITLVTTIGCSTTPGDAAYRGGHFEQAAKLYEEGAKLGDGTAALKLGLMISDNEIEKAKYGNAIKWYMRACNLGNEGGCHNSGHAYEYGKVGAIKSYRKARNYYTLAAEKGFMQSQYNLGSLYSNQYLNDDIEGLKWLLIAEKTARKCSNVPICQWVVKDPPGHRIKLKRRMNDSQISKSRRIANEWRVKK